MIGRRDFLRLSLASAATIALGATAPRRRPNVLFILSDDQRTDTIAALGNAHIRTPNLDRLVNRGLAFTNAHIMGGTQGAICVSSRSMILTGRTLPHSPDNPPPRLTLWPELLRHSGYTTFITGKWHNGPATLARCFSAGANIFLGGMGEQSRVKVHDFDPSGKYPAKTARTGTKFSSELFADSAVEFLESYKDDRPFAMWVAFTAPHDPRTPPERFARMYDPKKLPLPGNFTPRHPFDNGEMNVRDEKLLPTPRDPDALRREMALYYGMISHMDEQIGRILDALEKSGQAENTIIIFAGDNGLALGSHGLLGKQNLYEHSVGVPLVMAGPGIPGGRRANGMCYLLDIYPTLCESIGIEAPATVEGRSLMPAIRDPQSRLRELLVFSYRSIQKSVRDERFKLIRYSVNGKTTEQLFDLQSDPLELKDLSEDPACAEQRKRLEKAL